MTPAAPCFNTFRFTPHSPSPSHNYPLFLSCRWGSESTYHAFYTLAFTRDAALISNAHHYSVTNAGPRKNHQQHSPITVLQHPPASVPIGLPFSGNGEGDQDISPSGEVRPSTRSCQDRWFQLNETSLRTILVSHLSTPPTLFDSLFLNYSLLPQIYLFGCRTSSDL